MFKSCLLLFLFVGLVASSSSADASSLEERIVKISAVQQSYSLTHPWRRNSSKELSGSGFVFKAGYVLTNAHVVKNARQLYIQPYQSSLKIEAEVVAIAYKMDLALIKPVEDALMDFEEMELDASIPIVTETVNIFGYPMGGDELAITEGVVSRIEYTRFAEGQQGLRLQVDAAINSGNSGGPAFVGDRFVGIVFSRIKEADGIGYVIAADEVVDFLADIEDGNYDGKPGFFYRFSDLQNENLRERLGLAPEQGGQLVTDVLDDRLGEDGLKEMDVLLKIGDHDIDRSGNVRLRDDLRLSMGYFVNKTQLDGVLPVTILRDGEVMETQVSLSSDWYRLLPYINEKQTPYFVYGPLVFAKASHEFVGGMPSKLRSNLNVLGHELLYRRYDQKDFPGEEKVICPSRMLSHSMTKGVRDPAYSVLRRVNGVEVESIRHLVEELSKLDRVDDVVFEFRNAEHSRTNVIVLKHGEVLDAIDDLLTDNGIRFPYSSEFEELWSEY